MSPSFKPAKEISPPTPRQGGTCIAGGEPCSSSGIVEKEPLATEGEETVSVPELPSHGYETNRYHTPYVELMSDESLAELNRLLNWKCFTVDSQGRRFGNMAWQGKRSNPQVIPDRRIQLLDEKLSLADKTVLEVGCFEGIHTIALCQRAKAVKAIDCRVTNVVNTLVRVNMFNYKPTVFQYDIDIPDIDTDLLRADVLHHVGVLYHLHDPVRHLLQLKNFIHTGLMLDTHYALPEDTNGHYEVNGKVYAYKRYKEKGYQDPFSGIHEDSKWLLLEDILELLKQIGFSEIILVEPRKERNGPRVLIIARTPSKNDISSV